MMKIDTSQFEFYNNYNKVNSKEELIELLKTYKGILSDSMINYLNSLIELEFSVIREYISNENRKALSELEIYKKIAIYNIYNRALNIFKQTNMKFNFSSNEDGHEWLMVSTSINERYIKLFDFNYTEYPIGFNNKIPVDYKTMKIGNIKLYKTLESEELRQAELNRIMEKLEKLYDEKNPYESYSNVSGGPGATWIFEHSKKIKEYEQRFTELDKKKKLNDDDKKEIEITKYIHELFLNDYGLTNKSFEIEDDSFISVGKKNELQKTLAKNIPNIKIENNIKYI